MNPQQPWTPQENNVPVPPAPQNPAFPQMPPQPQNVPSMPMMGPQQPPMMPTQPTMGGRGDMPPKPSGPISKKMIIIVGSVIGAVIAALLIISLTRSSDKNNSATTDKNADNTRNVSTNDQTKKDTVDNTIPDNVQNTPATAKSESRLAVTIDEPNLGYQLKLNKLVRNAPDARADKTEETILIEVTGSNTGGKFYGAPSSFEFKILADGAATEIPYVITYDTKQILTGLGLAFYDSTNVSVSKGIKSTTGYVAFRIPKGTKAATFRYKVKEQKISGANGGTIPAKNYDAKLF